MRKYDEEFKREALAKVIDGQSVASVARELGVAEGLIHNWKKQIKATNTGSENDLIALKKELREVKMENEILKKAALIFGRGG